MKTINLEQFAQNRTTLLASKTKGADARNELELDSLDKGSDQIMVIIPEYIITITPSFFLGLFSKSLETLGEDNFFKKYHFNDKRDTIQRQIKSSVDDWKSAQ